MEASHDKKTIALTAGGTGGHVFPALSLAEELQDRDHKVIFITDQRGEKYRHTMTLNHFHVMSLSKGRGILGKIGQLMTIVLAFLRILPLFWRAKPVVVVGFGGYTSVPALLAAKCLRIPILLYEQNAILGRVNQFLAR